MKPRHCTRRTAFTLAELLIVVALIAVLLGILLKARQMGKANIQTAVAMSFSPDGKQLTTASEDGSIRIWDISNSKEVASQRRFFTDRIAFSPDGKLAARTVPLPDNREDHRTYALETCNLSTGKVITRRNIEMTLNATGLAFSPDGKRLAYVETPANKIIVVDSFDSSAPAIELGPVDPSKPSLGFTDLEMEFSPDGESLYVLRLFNELAKWDIATGTAKHTTIAPQDEWKLWGRHLSVSPNGKRLAVFRESSESVSRVALIDAETLRVLRELPLRSETSYCRGLEYLDSGKSLALIGEKLTILDAERLQIQNQIECEYSYALAANPKEKQLAIGRMHSIALSDGNSAWTFVGVPDGVAWLATAFWLVLLVLIVKCWRMVKRKRTRSNSG